MLKDSLEQLVNCGLLRTVHLADGIVQAECKPMRMHVSRGFIEDPANKTKSMIFTEEGLRESE